MGTPVCHSEALICEGHMKSHDTIEDGIEIQASPSWFQLNLNVQEIDVNFSSNKLLERGVTEFGCQHYRRSCRIRAPCCNEVFDCRHCHNEAKNSIDVDSVHRQDLPRHEVQKVICSLCGTEQTTSKKQYHCNGCGICRTGGQENFFHCSSCGSHSVQ